VRIGYSVEGSTDRALLTGLRNRWCPHAELIEGQFRGQTETRRRAEVRNICRELVHRDASVIIFLTDANRASWREVRRREEQWCPAEFRGRAVFGVCDRNVESWLCSDPGYPAAQFGRGVAEFQCEDPKGPLEAGFGVTGFDKREEAIARFVAEAPLRRWMTNPSFQDFYDQLWQRSKELGCKLENLRAAAGYKPGGAL